MSPRLKVVLMVDDEPDHVELVRRAFRIKMPETDFFAVPSFTEAVDLLRSGTLPQVILADWRLPDGQGVGLLDLKAPCPVILFTAFGSERLAVEALKRGATDYVVKSEAALSDMPHIAERALDQWKTMQQKESVEQALRESEERFALAANGSNDVVWDWDIASDLLFLSTRWIAMFGQEGAPQPRTMEEWFTLVHPRDVRRLRAGLLLHLHGESPHFEHEHRIRSPRGDYRWALTRGLAVRRGGRAPYRMAGSLTEITLRKNMEEQMVFNAFHDTLTGLYNRGIFLERLEHRTKVWQSQRDHPFALLLLDVDRFKFINDSFGHAAGDTFLQLMAGRMSKRLRLTDTIARFGGDDFAILLDPVNGMEDALKFASDIRRDLCEPLFLAAQTVYPSVTIGVALSGDHDLRAQDLVQSADSALHEAKSGGSLRIAASQNAASSTTRGRLKLEHDIRRAIACREFAIAYQPVACLPRGEIKHWECLLRWRRSNGEWAPASEFIPLAEDVGLVAELDHLALTLAAEQQRRWRGSLGIDVKLSVNLSAAFLSRPSLLESLQETLDLAGSSEQWLSIEITERSLIGCLSLLEHAVPKLTELNIGVWLDDFGAGYSSLNYLASLPVQMLKIDSSFTSRMLESPRSQAVVKAILSMAGSLDIPVVAEGVETRRQAERLAELGCPFGQGYHLYPPVFAENVESVLRHNPSDGK
ncbi:MAG: EAL domain-containing protein [Bryobacterales bacterium]|nr:EAL domain-containing protein [Bryobacterales bacterium]